MTSELKAARVSMVTRSGYFSRHAPKCTAVYELALSPALVDEVDIVAQEEQSKQAKNKSILFH